MGREASWCQAPVLVEGWLSGVEGLGGRFGSSGDGGLVGLAEGLRGEAAEREMGPEGKSIAVVDIVTCTEHDNYGDGGGVLGR